MSNTNRYFKRKLKKQITVYKNRVLCSENPPKRIRICEEIVNRPELYLEEEISDENNRATEDCELSNQSLKEKLKKWFIQTKPTRSCAENLLSILSEEGLDVPLSLEGLLGKTSKIEIRSVSPGSFHYLGIENQLKKIENVLKNYSSVELEINVDGIPLFKGSKTQLWPILIKVVNTEEKIMPMPIGIFVGPGKPNCIENYLKDFVEEVKFLNGKVNISGKATALKLRHLCCDTPAKSFVCCVPGHTSAHGYTKCTQVAKKNT